MQYRFTRPHKHFGKKMSDPVPSDWGEGVIRALLDNHYIEAINEKSFEAPPADKAFKPRRVRRKAAVA